MPFSFRRRAQGGYAPPMPSQMAPQQDSRMDELLARLMERIDGLEQMLRQGQQRGSGTSGGAGQGAGAGAGGAGAGGRAGGPNVQMPPMRDEAMERRDAILGSYQRYLGGPPSPPELAGYLSMTPEQIIAAVANSQEARNFAASRQTARTPQWQAANGVKPSLPDRGEIPSSGGVLPQPQIIDDSGAPGALRDPNATYDGGPQGNVPQGGAGVYAGESGFTREGKMRLSPNDPDAPGLLAKYPGQYVMDPRPAAARYPAQAAPPPPPTTTYTPPAGGPAVTTGGVPGAAAPVTVPTSQFAGGILPPWFADAMAGRPVSAGGTATPPPPDPYVNTTPDPEEEWRRDDDWSGVDGAHSQAY